ncbi:hypothetical protein M1403_03155 [Patescibacteria group bacterium]|nr:hypothetical protein [Patescibacteria group bacterium]
MQSLKTVLNKINLNNNEDKYLSREFQQYGIYLTEKLEDMAHKALYIKLAKQTPRDLLDQALSFVLDANAQSKGKLFMWKLAQLKKRSAIEDRR